MTIAPPCPAIQQLEAFVLGQLSGHEVPSLARHLKQCSLCSGRVNQIMGVDSGTALLQGQRPSPGHATIPSQCPGSKGNSIAAPGAVPYLRPAVQPDEIGRLAGYRVLRLLGSGGMGMVFEAEDVALRRPVAIKVLKKELASQEDFWQRFLREARTLASIKHEHVVTVYQAGQEDATVYLVMERLQGQTLADHIEQARRLPLAEILRLGREIATGLAVVHSHGLIHRDIKPANIWLEAPHGRVKLLDFGLARPIISTTPLTEVGLAVGTPAFMSPEQARGLPADARTDLFSLGCILYLLSAGTEPFAGTDTMAQLVALATEIPAPLTARNPEIPQAFADLVAHLLAKKPQDRPSSAEDVIASIRQLEQSLSQGTSQTGPIIAQPVRKNSSQRTLSVESIPSGQFHKWAGLLVGLTMVLGIGFLCSLFAAWFAYKAFASPGQSLATAPKPEIPLQQPNELSRPESEFLSDWQPIASEGGPPEQTPGRLRPPPPGNEFRPPPAPVPPLFVNGERLPHGIWMHGSPEGRASLTYALHKRFDVFSSAVSLNDSSASSPLPLTFTVYGDGKLLWSSNPLTTREQGQSCTVSVKGVDRLELVVSNPQGRPDELMGAHAVWLEPKITAK